jgi:hypothetical protein
MVYGCNTEELDLTSDQKVDDSSVYIFNSSGDNPIWEAVSQDDLLITQSNSGSAINRSNNGNSGHTHGDFPGVEFSGTQNNGGTHGSATVSLGPNTYTLETECVMVDGNEAVYGGTITEVSGPPPPPGPGPPVYSPGEYLYFKVFDSGQGNNADPDQFYGSIKHSTSSQCGNWTPGNTAVWPPTITIIFPWGPVTINFINDIPEPGSVKVNN